MKRLIDSHDQHCEMPTRLFKLRTDSLSHFQKFSIKIQAEHEKQNQKVVITDFGFLVFEVSNKNNLGNRFVV